MVSWKAREITNFRVEAIRGIVENYNTINAEIHYLRNRQTFIGMTQAELDRECMRIASRLMRAYQFISTEMRLIQALDLDYIRYSKDWCAKGND